MSLNQDPSHEFQLLQLVSYYSKATLQIEVTLDQEKPFCVSKVTSSGAKYS